MPFEKLLDWWWEHHGKALRSPTVHSFLEKHLRETLGPLLLRDVTTARIEKLLTEGRRLFRYTWGR